jgi:hypothetical protein
MANALRLPVGAEGIRWVRNYCHNRHCYNRHCYTSQFKGVSWSRDFDRSLAMSASAKLPFIPAGIALLCIAAICALQFPQLQRLKTTSQTATAAELYQATSAEQARLKLLKTMPAFGFDNALADWTFLNFLQYFGDQPARAKTDYSLSPDYFEIILDRDPYFINAYTFLSTSAALYAAMPERSVAIARQNLAALKPNVPPESYYAWRQVAIDELLFLGDSQAARQSFETAASWAKQAGNPDGDRVAAMSLQTAAFLVRNPNSKTAQVSAWVMVLGNATDPRTRNIARQRIESLGGKIIPRSDGSFGIQPPATDE